jgi:4-nitrophenyl phosphatase
MPDALIDRYAGVVFDIDGVLCRGESALPGAAEVLRALRARDLGLALVTNNAGRTPAQIVAWLDGMGLTIAPDEVLTSSIAAATLVEPGTRCVVIGADGLREALRARGAVTVTDPQQAQAVVVGIDVNLHYDDLRRAAQALHAGARFVATNADRTFPMSDGLWPGNGATIAALTAATGREPEIAGKPQPALFAAAATRIGRTPLLMVGDRVETDIDGAAALGWDTALVLTGVSTADMPEVARATMVLEDLRGLLHAPAA